MRSPPSTGPAAQASIQGSRSARATVSIPPAAGTVIGTRSGSVAEAAGQHRRDHPHHGYHCNEHDAGRPQRCRERRRSPPSILRCGRRPVAPACARGRCGRLLESPTTTSPSSHPEPIAADPGGHDLRCRPNRFRRAGQRYLGPSSTTRVPSAKRSCQPCLVGLEPMVTAMPRAANNHSTPPIHGMRLSSM